jgi:hypothetical protein
MSLNSLGVTLDADDSVMLYANRSEMSIFMVINTDGVVCEIRVERAHIAALRDQAPLVLADLDRWAAEDEDCT